MGWRIRGAGDGDLGFLWEMLHAAATWRERRAPIDEKAVSNDPRVARYLAGWGRGGDTALVAVDGEGQPAGAAWFRFFSPDEPGYGFIDDTVPELSIAVRGDLRGRGVGTALLDALVDAAAERGLRALSLSVEEDNPALTLYRRAGFRAVERVGNALTMRLDLEPRVETECHREPGSRSGR